MLHNRFWTLLQLLQLLFALMSPLPPASLHRWDKHKELPLCLYSQESELLWYQNLHYSQEMSLSRFSSGFLCFVSFFIIMCLFGVILTELSGTSDTHKEHRT